MQNIANHAKSYLSISIAFFSVVYFRFLPPAANTFVRPFLAHIGAHVSSEHRCVVILFGVFVTDVLLICVGVHRSFESAKTRFIMPASAGQRVSHKVVFAIIEMYLVRLWIDLIRYLRKWNWLRNVGP